MYTLGEGGGKLNICGLDRSGSETFMYSQASILSLCRLMVMTLRARKAKDRYDLTNYMAADDPDVELISHRKLPWGTTFEDIVDQQ